MIEKTELQKALTSIPVDQYVSQCLSMVLHHEEVALIADVVKRIQAEETNEHEGATE